MSALVIHEIVLPPSESVPTTTTRLVHVTRLKINQPIGIGVTGDGVSVSHFSDWR